MENKLFMTGMGSIIAAAISLLPYIFYPNFADICLPIMGVLFVCGFSLIIISHIFSKKVSSKQLTTAFRTFRNIDLERTRRCMRLRDLPDKELLYKLFYSRDNSERIIFFRTLNDKKAVGVAHQKAVLYSWEALREAGALGVWKTLEPLSCYENIEQALKENLEKTENYCEETLAERVEKKRRIFILRKKMISGCGGSIYIWVDGMRGKLKNGRGVMLETDCNLHVLRAGGSIMIIGASEEDCVIFIEILPVIQFVADNYHLPCKFEKVNEFGDKIPIESSEYIFGI